jgi:hypothetical protein
MNLMKTSRALAAIAFAAIGFAVPSHAAVTAAFSAGATCGNATSANFSPGGAPVQVSLCMTTTTEASCGHTIVLQSAVGEAGKFVVTSSALAAPFTDPNSDVSQLPLAINNPPTIADLGGTGSAPAAAATNRLLATFNLAPQVGATAGSYVISLNSVSMAAIDADGTCGVTTVPSESPIAASFTLTRSAAPVFTSASSATFSTASANTFAVTATGIPTPTITAGATPAGVTFTSGGANSGTGTIATANGTFTAGSITLTATSGAATQQQTFILTAAGQASQTINFTNPGQQTFSPTLLPLVAVASSGGAVTFSTQTPSICTAFNGNLTMVTLGTCTILANQAGSATFLPAQASVSFGIVGGVPGAPTGVAATAGNTQAAIAFTAPASTGGVAISGYTATCIAGASTVSATATSSPITVPGLTNGTPYACTVSAANALGTGPASAPPVNVTPIAGALTLVSVKSRKVHGQNTVLNPNVTYDLALDTAPLINGLVTTEPRNAGASGHQIVFKFNNPITAAGTATTVATDRFGVAIASPGAVPTFTVGSDEVIVTLSGVVDMSRVTITLAGVNTTGPNAVVSLGFLIADMNNNRAVNSGDVVGAAVRSGIPLDQTNFRFDFNLNGLINSGDIVGAAVRSGNGI